MCIRDSTIISHYEAGYKVNLEVDMIARYLERLLNAGHEDADHTKGVSMDLLAAKEERTLIMTWT